MDTQKFDVEHLPRKIVLGRQTETGVMSVRVDCKSWLGAWPTMLIRAWVVPLKGDGHFVTTYMDGTELVWPITDRDTVQAGEGTMELVGTTGGVRVLSDIVGIEIR